MNDTSSTAETRGQRIRRLREAKNMSLETLATRSYLSVLWLEQVEKDMVDYPASSHLRDIAKALGTSIGVLEGWG